MDFNLNKNNGKRKAQSIHDMINASPGMSAGIKKSAYKGPKNAPSINSSTSDNIIGDIDSSSRWGNSNVGMPEPKKQRVKSDVPNPMRGNLFTRNRKGASPKGYIMQSGSNYSGPKVKRPRSEALDEYSNDERYSSNEKYRRNTDNVQYSGLLDDVGYIIFTGLLAVCIIATLVVSGLKPRKNNYSYPLNIFSMTGVINRIHESKMGISNTKDNSALTIVESEEVSTDTDSDSGNKKIVELASESDLNKLGDEELPSTLDDGTMQFTGYSKASTHEELVEQLDQALSAGDVDFVSAKLAYENEKGMIASYPFSVVKHFCEYMAGNSDKRAAFITAMKKDEYAGKNGSAEVIMLPLVKFIIKLDDNSDKQYFNNTVISVSGFSEQLASANQNATIYPLLPCFYDVTMSNNAWPSSKTQQIEATLGEGNLEITVGKGN